MQVFIHDTVAEMAVKVAETGASVIRDAVRAKGEATIILATGASQIEMLDQLIGQADIDWSAVTIFHLDEYCGIDRDHPASFRRYMRERVAEKLPNLKRFVWIEGDAADIGAEIARLNSEIAARPVDIAFIGIGENGHLAFNEPPANFEAESPYLIVELDETSRRQQVGEGWFSSLDTVPLTAISMSLRQILKSARLMVTVPDERKAAAVRAALEGAIDRACPASILRTHPRVEVHLDKPAASQLVYFSA
ncbi:glucosamine-6-phosphate deaminase [Pseudokordiimonas caeni]|uniref:glucosamine-6-phosphate deaminase n=1 Tax=Pseudokordiimonas caeni TaxID=2997908 RepID=UPI0028113997|nr:glucosamine-6-phosphate deaminase [Pseudokordiimonas caeni]